MAKPFRMFAEMLDDQLVQQLSDREFRFWVDLLCVLARHDGVVPDTETIAFETRRPSRLVEELMAILLGDGLLRQEAGRLCARDWSLRHHPSDLSTPRVREYRRSLKQHRIDAARNLLRDSRGEGAKS